MKYVILVIFMITGYMNVAQSSLNDYKYIIVPKKFEGFKNENQHQTSTLVKHLFVEAGFDAVYEDALPEDLNNNRCLGLVARLVDDSNMFTTKTSLSLVDCNAKVVLKTREGKSKEKDFKEAYGEAIREAFTTIQGMNYAYNGASAPERPLTANFKNDVKQVAEPAERRPANQRQSPAVRQEATQHNQSFKSREPAPSDYRKNGQGDEAKDSMADMEERPADNRPSASVVVQQSQATGGVPSASAGTGDVLYAQGLPNGYQLVDSSPKIRFRLLKTNVSDVYLANSQDKNGMVYQVNGNWFFEYYEGETLRTERLNIKF